jgi:hypothetical protein
MQQIIKKFRPLRWMTPFMIMATVFVVGCNNEPAKSEEPKVEVAPAPATPPTEKAVESKKATDSLPPLDSTAKSRPEPRKTAPVSPTKTQ